MPSVDLAHLQLHYEASGDGEPLLFLHGLGSSTRDWELQRRFFSDRYRVVTPDLRGHGQSDKPPGPYSIPLFAADVAEFIVALGIGPVHVVGISLGGFVATQLAVDRGDLVRSLVVVNSVPELPRATFGDRLRTRKDLLSRWLVVQLFGMRGLGRFVGKKLFPGPEQSRMRDTFVERWAENDPRAYLDTLAAVSRWTVKEELGSIRCPTCVVCGENDFFPEALKEEYVRRVPDVRRVVIAKSGHLTPIDQADAFNETVQAFLAEVSSRPR